MNDMNDNPDAHPKSTGGLVCGIIGCILGGTFYLSLFGFPFCLIAWILGAKAVNRARAMGVGAGGSAITAKVMGILGTIATGIATLILVTLVFIVTTSSGVNGGLRSTRCLSNRIMVETACATAALQDEKFETVEDLVEHGSLPRMPECPAGGEYVLMPGSDGKMTCVCSKHGARRALSR